LAGHDICPDHSLVNEHIKDSLHRVVHDRDLLTSVETREDDARSSVRHRTPAGKDARNNDKDLENAVHLGLLGRQTFGCILYYSGLIITYYAWLCQLLLLSLETRAKDAKIRLT